MSKKEKNPIFIEQVLNGKNNLITKKGGINDN